MKTLILFATKTGATREYAKLLAKSIPDCVLCDLSQETGDIRNFDMIIIGSGVRMGKIYKPVLNFLQQNIDVLLTKRVAVYLCNANSATFEKAVNKNIPATIIQSAITIKSFGGKPPFSNSKGSDWLYADGINEFTDIINSN